MFTVLVVAGIGVKIHFAGAVDKTLRRSFRDLFVSGPFWGAMVVLFGLFVTLNVFSYATMWGIVRICAGFVLWCLVLAWFLVFKTYPVTVVAAPHSTQFRAEAA